MGENTDLGRAVYEAYCEHREANDGATMPTWEQLTERVRSAWIAAGEAAISHDNDEVF
jgi:hypothetical protein